MDIDELMLLIDRNEISTVTKELSRQYYMSEPGSYIADLVRNYLLVHLGNYETSLKYYQQIAKDLDNAEHQDTSKLKVWNCYIALESSWRNGSREISLKILKKLEDMIAEVPQSQITLWILRFGRLEAITKYLVGDLNEALVIADRLRETALEFGYERELCLIENTLGYFYRIKGQISKSLYYHKRALPILQREKLIVQLGNCYENIALCYSRAGEYEKVTEPLKESLTLREHSGNSYYLSWTLYTIIKHFFQTKQFEKIQSYLEKLEYLRNSESNRDIRNRYKMCKALSLRTSGRFRMMVTASNYFREVISDPSASFELIIHAKLYEAELMVDEAFASQSNDAYLEATQMLDELIQITSKSMLFDSLITSVMLRSRLYLLKRDFVEGKAILVMGLEVAKDKNLDYLKYLIEDEIIKYEQEVRDINAKELVEDIDLELGDAPEEFQMDATFSDSGIKFVLLILQHVQGRILHSRLFSERTIDKQTLNHVKSIINKFGSEMKENLTEIVSGEFEVEDFQMLVKKQENIVLSIITNGKSYASHDYSNHILAVLKDNVNLWNKINRDSHTQPISNRYLDLINMMIADETKYFAIEL